MSQTKINKEYAAMITEYKSDQAAVRAEFMANRAKSISATEARREEIKQKMAEMMAKVGISPKAEASADASHHDDHQVVKLGGVDDASADHHQ